MKKISVFFVFCATVILFTGFRTAKSNKASQQVLTSPADKALYDTINYLDSILFDAFNTCKIEKFKTLFTADLEFYHDKGGLTNYTQSIESLKDKCSRSWTVRRELVPGSVEVYPVKDYGAMQIGSHRFYNTEKGPEELGGTFKFLHVWKKTKGGWQISRVMSYDH